MAPRKETASRDGATLVHVKSVNAPAPAGSKLPAFVAFPLLAIISLSLHTFLYSFVAPLSDYELSSVSRTLNEAWQPAAFLGYKFLELAVGWYLRYDYYDLAALTILTHGPYFFLLTTFYSISASTALAALGVDILALALPFRLLRPRAPARLASAPSSAVPNKTIVTDLSIRALTSIFAAGIYGVIVFASFATWLLPHLAAHFDGLRSFDIAHAALLPSLVLLALPTGWAARTFLFDSSVAARPSLADARRSAFNPETATLGETLAHNVWGWRFSTRVLIKRLVVLLIMQGLNNWLRVWITIDGAESAGAAGWAAMWVTATSLVGLALGWVSDV